MRIAYIYLSANYKGSSVQNKVMAQISALRSLGIDCVGRFFSQEKADLTPPFFQEKIEFINNSSEGNGLFQSVKSRSKVILELDYWLSNNLNLFDYFYVRYPGASKEFNKLMSKYGSKIFLEFQTINTSEIISTYKDNPFGLKPSKFLSWIEFQFLPLYNEFVYSSRIARKARGIVGVTTEIMEVVKRKVKDDRGLIFASIGNGVDVNKIEARKQLPDYSHNNYKLLILIGGSGGNRWIGLDKIIDGLSKYNGKSNYELWVCGNVNKDEYLDLENVKYLGYKNGVEIDLLMEETHLALGSFAMERAGLTQGSTLKLREYCARGIPFIFGHVDEDMVLLEKSGLTLRFKANEMVDFAKVDLFLANLLNKKDTILELRNYALENLDYSVKMKNLSEVFKLGYRG
jgi:hypothetical protein